MKLIIYYIITHLLSQELDFEYPYYTTLIQLPKSHIIKNAKKTHVVEDLFISSSTDIAQASTLNSDSKGQGSIEPIKATYNPHSTPTKGLDSNILPDKDHLAERVDANIITPKLTVNEKVENVDTILGQRKEKEIKLIEELEAWIDTKENNLQSCDQTHDKSISNLNKDIIEANKLIKQGYDKINEISKEISNDPQTKIVDKRFNNLSNWLNINSIYVIRSMQAAGLAPTYLQRKIDEINTSKQSNINELGIVRGYKETIKNQKSKIYKCQSIDQIQNILLLLTDIKNAKKADNQTNKACGEVNGDKIMANMKKEVKSGQDLTETQSLIYLIRNLFIKSKKTKEIEESSASKLIEIKEPGFLCNTFDSKCDYDKKIKDIKKLIPKVSDAKTAYYEAKKLKLQYDNLVTNSSEYENNKSLVTDVFNEIQKSVKNSKSNVIEAIQSLLTKVNKINRESEELKQTAFIKDLTKIDDRFTPIIMAPFSLKFFNENLFKNLSRDHFTKKKYNDFINRMKIEVKSRPVPVLNYATNGFNSDVYINIHSEITKLMELEAEKERLRLLAEELKQNISNLFGRLTNLNQYNFVEQIRPLLNQYSRNVASLDQIKHSFIHFENNKKLEFYNKMIIKISELFHQKRDYINLRLLEDFVYINEINTKMNLRESFNKFEKEEKDTFTNFVRREQTKAKSVFNKDIDGFKLIIKEYFKKKLVEAESVVYHRLDGIKREDYLRYQALKHDLKLEEKYLKLLYKKETDNIKIDIKKYFKNSILQTNQFLQNYLNLINNS